MLLVLGAALLAAMPQVDHSKGFGGVVGTLGDLDGDGHDEPVVGSADEVAVFSGADGKHLAHGPWAGGRLIGDLDADGVRGFRGAGPHPCRSCRARASQPCGR